MIVEHSKTKTTAKIKINTFKSKYGNTKLSNVWKYKKVRFVLEVFASVCLY